METGTLTVRAKNKQLLVDFPDGIPTYSYLETVLHAALSTGRQRGVSFRYTPESKVPTGRSASRASFLSNPALEFSKGLQNP